MITIRGYLQTKGLDEIGQKLLKIGSVLGGDSVVFERNEYLSRLKKLKGMGFVDDAIEELEKNFFTHVLPLSRIGWLKRDEWNKFISITDRIYHYERIRLNPSIESRFDKIVSELNSEGMCIWWYGNVEVGIYLLQMRWEK